MTDPHTTTLRRYQRGMTPTRPSRPLYGYEVRCTCGYTERVNGTKREAEGFARDHRRTAAEINEDTLPSHGGSHER